MEQQLIQIQYFLLYLSINFNACYDHIKLISILYLYLLCCQALVVGMEIYLLRGSSMEGSSKAR